MCYPTRRFFFYVLLLFAATSCVHLELEKTYEVDQCQVVGLGAIQYEFVLESEGVQVYASSTMKWLFTPNYPTDGNRPDFFSCSYNISVKDLGCVSGASGLFVNLAEGAGGNLTGARGRMLAEVACVGNGTGDTVSSTTLNIKYDPEGIYLRPEENRTEFYSGDPLPSPPVMPWESPMKSISGSSLRLLDNGTLTEPEGFKLLVQSDPYLSQATVYILQFPSVQDLIPDFLVREKLYVFVLVDGMGKIISNDSFSIEVLQGNKTKPTPTSTLTTASDTTNTPTSTVGSGGKSGGSDNKIIAIVVGATCAALILFGVTVASAVAIVIWWKRRNRKPSGANVSSTYSNIHEGQRNGRLSVGAGPDDPPLPVVVDVQERLDKHNQRIANLEGRMDYNDERIDEMDAAQLEGPIG